MFTCKSLLSLCLVLSLLSTLETTFDGSVTTDISNGGGSGGGSNTSGGGRSILSLTSSRPSLSSWRLGQSSPRLQAGDAPSMGNGYAGRVVTGQGGRYLYPGHLRRQLAGRGGAPCSVDLGDRAGEDIDLDGIAMEVTGYMSDGDVLSKNAARTDDVTSGYVNYTDFLILQKYFEIVNAISPLTLGSCDMWQCFLFLWNKSLIKNHEKVIKHLQRDIHI